jgi:hypothetical protein
MGTWNTNINGNDAYADIYGRFFELYNKGEYLAVISAQIQNQYSEMFDDEEDRNNSLFGLAFAQWETKSLDPAIFEQVKNIIESGSDLELWKELGADKNMIKKRASALQNFLKTISTEREKPKRKVKPKFTFELVSIVDIIAPDAKKKFSVSEEYTNSNYIHSSGLVMWRDGGGSVLYFKGQGQHISAKWLDSQTLEVTHDKGIVFTKKDNSSYYYGDDVKLIYIEQ